MKQSPAKIKIFLSDAAPAFTLDRVEFYCDDQPAPIISRRGGIPAPMSSPLDGVFIWSSAVKSLAILLVRTAASPDIRAEIYGDAGSPAASLDYAISKEPNWLMDMFGIDESGKCRAKTLFRRQNSERKQPGPVRVWLDPTVLSGTEIAVFRNESRVSKLSTISSFAMLIEAEWYASTRNSSRKLYSHSKRHGSSDLIIKFRKHEYSVDPKTQTATIASSYKTFNAARYPVMSRQCNMSFDNLEHLDGPRVFSKEDPDISVTPVAIHAKERRYSIVFGKPLQPGETVSYQQWNSMKGDALRTPFYFARIHTPTELLSFRISFGPGWHFANHTVVKEINETISVQDVPPSKVITDDNGVEYLVWSIKNPEFGARYTAHWDPVQKVDAADITSADATRLLNDDEHDDDSH